MKTINELLGLLKEHKCEIDVKHISYKPISRKMYTKPAELTDTEKKEVTEAVVKANTTSEMKAALEAGDKLISEKQAIKFTWAQDRFRISSITGNDSRANVSILVKIPGSVELPESAPQNLPRIFGTFIWRNYAVVKDAVLNIEKLPVVLNRKAYDKLTAEGVITAPWLEGYIYEIDLGQFKITNWTDPLNPKEYAQDQLNLIYAKASKKVLKHFSEQLEPKDNSKTLKEMYGEEATNWLESIGITDNGYAPKTEAHEPTEYYEAKELQVKAKGLTIPSVNTLLKKLDGNKKLNSGDQYLKKVMDQVTEVLDSLKTAEEKINWLKSAKRENTEEIDHLSDILEMKKMAIIADGAWFEGYTKGQTAEIQHPCGYTLEVSTSISKIYK